MYAFPEMIDMGLKEGQQWPSEIHRAVAQNLALYNPDVRTRDHLTDIVQKIITVPMDRIKMLTLAQARDEFQVPV